MVRILLLSILASTSACGLLQPERPFACVDLPMPVCEEAWAAIEKETWPTTDQLLHPAIGRTDGSEGGCQPGFYDEVVIVKVGLASGDSETFFLEPGPDGRLVIAAVHMRTDDPDCRLSDGHC